jgi:hypothetical protein
VRGRYRTVAITFDMDGLTEGDYDDFSRAVNAIEREIPGAHLLGQDETHSWPSYVVRETLPVKQA